MRDMPVGHTWLLSDKIPPQVQTVAHALLRRVGGQEDASDGFQIPVLLLTNAERLARWVQHHVLVQSAFVFAVICFFFVASLPQFTSL